MQVDRCLGSNRGLPGIDGPPGGPRPITRPLPSRAVALPGWAAFYCWTMRKWVIPAAVLVITSTSAALYWFQPWKLFTSRTVNDVVPVVDAGGTTPAIAESAAPPP